jgi:hypothetical protein
VLRCCSWLVATSTSAGFTAWAACAADLSRSVPERATGRHLTYSRDLTAAGRRRAPSSQEQRIHDPTASVRRPTQSRTDPTHRHHPARQLDHEQARAAGTTVLEAAEVLRELTQELLPDALTEVSVNLDTPHGPPVPGRTSPIHTDSKAGLELDLGARRLLVDGEEVELAFREFELLSCLAASGGRGPPERTPLDAFWPSRRRNHVDGWCPRRA